MGILSLFRRTSTAASVAEAPAAPAAPAAPNIYGLDLETLIEELRSGDFSEAPASLFIGELGDRLRNQEEENAARIIDALEAAVRKPNWLKPDEVSDVFYQLLSASVFTGDHSPEQIHRRLDAAHSLLKDGFAPPLPEDTRGRTSVARLAYLAYEAAEPRAHVSYSSDIWWREEIVKWEAERFGLKGIDILKDLILKGPLREAEIIDAIEDICRLGHLHGHHAAGFAALADIGDEMVRRSEKATHAVVKKLHDATRRLVADATDPQALANLDGAEDNNALSLVFARAGLSKAANYDSQLLAVIGSARELLETSIPHLNALLAMRHSAGFQNAAPPVRYVAPSGGD